MDLKKTLMISAGSTLVGSAVTGKKALEKGFSLGFKIGIVSGLTIGILGTVLGLVGKDRIEEKLA